MRHIPFLFLLFIFATGFAEENGMNFEHDATWQQVLDKAKKEHKFILMDAYTSWCGPCKWMSKEIFPQPKVGAAVNSKYVCCKFDMEKGEGLELAKKYEVRNYPTYLFFNPDGRLVHRAVGTLGADDFIQLCNDALDSTKQYFTLRDKYLKGQRDSMFLRQFSFVADNAQDSLSKISMMKYFQANNNQLNENTIQFLFALTSNLHDTTFSILINNKEEYYKVIGKDKVDATIEELVWNEARKFGKKGTDTVAFRKVIQQYLPEKTGMLTAEYEISLMKRANDTKGYLPKAEAFAAKYCMNDPDRLQEIANNMLEFYKDKAVWERALKLALRSIELKSNYYNNSTAAHLYYRLGDKKNAKLYAETSLEKGKEEKEETFEIEGFLKSLK